MSSVEDDRTSVALSLNNSNSQMEKTKEKVQRREFKIFLLHSCFLPKDYVWLVI